MHLVPHFPDVTFGAYTITSGNAPIPSPFNIWQERRQLVKALLNGGFLMKV